MKLFQQVIPLASPRGAGENVTFFPTYGSRLPGGGGWKVNVRGWVYRPKESSLKRAIVLSLLRRAARLDRETLASKIMKGRLRPFLFDNKRGRRFSIQLGDARYELPASLPNGHFLSSLDITDDGLETSGTEMPERTITRSFSLITDDMEAGDRAGEFELIGAEGLSVITDIDDTIKVSQVTDRRELFANTFLRKFQAAARMADVYREWGAQGASFHYVSASPWQLFHPLAELFSVERFPAGSVHLREFRLKDRSLKAFLAKNDVSKRIVCEQILRDFPRRQFVLVGDSGERDPEMYAELAREFPGQIRNILIRNVTGETEQSERMRGAFAGVADERWSLFSPEEGPDSEIA